jgi:hypothetical protein
MFSIQCTEKYTLNNRIVLSRSYYVSVILFVLCAAVPVVAEDTGDVEPDKGPGVDLELGRFHIANMPKFLEDGIQNDFLFGFFYSDAMKIAGDIRIRYVADSSSNIKLWDIDDSMINRSRQVCEVFLLPFNYYFFRGSGFKLHAGVGLYYEYNKLNENGYFNDRDFYEPPGDDNYNAYTNDFNAHALGPLLDIGMSYRKGMFYGAFSVGSVPVHYLNREQHWKLSPFMKPTPSYSVASESVHGPYFYVNLDMLITLKYVSLFVSLLGEYSRLQYTAAGFDNEINWIDVTEESENKVLSLEISILIPLGKSGIQMQIGYGRRFDEASGENYLLLGARKEWF